MVRQVGGRFSDAHSQAGPAYGRVGVIIDILFATVGYHGYLTGYIA